METGPIWTASPANQSSLCVCLFVLRQFAPLRDIWRHVSSLWTPEL